MGILTIFGQNEWVILMAQLVSALRWIGTWSDRKKTDFRFGLYNKKYIICKKKALFYMTLTL